MMSSGEWKVIVKHDNLWNLEENTADFSVNFVTADGQALLGAGISAGIITEMEILFWRNFHHWLHLDGLVQERRNSSALAIQLDLCLSCTNPST